MNKGYKYTQKYTCTIDLNTNFVCSYICHTTRHRGSNLNKGRYFIPKHKTLMF